MRHLLLLNAKVLVQIAGALEVWILGLPGVLELRRGLQQGLHSSLAGPTKRTV